MFWDEKGFEMRGLKLGILTATALALLPLCAAQAQQVININGVEATRVVIGPATSHWLKPSNLV